MKRPEYGRYVLWLVLALPAAGMLWAWATAPDDYGYGHIIGHSGDWAVWLLMFTLAITPIRLMFKKQRWAAWLMRRRRDFGLASFGYALGHTIIYLADKAELGAILFELGFPDILFGWIALAAFVPLALTSNNFSTRRMGRWWKRLHWLIYPAAALTFIHWVLAAFDPGVAYAHIAVLAAIIALRIGLEMRQRVV
jgi:sulfoxide reductase heme-binding subunit YedZ